MKANAAHRRIGPVMPPGYVGGMTDAARKTFNGSRQIHSPLAAWFADKQAEPAPEHLVALADELEAACEPALVKKAS